MRGGSAELVHSESGDFGRGARWDNGNALPQALPVLYHLLVLHLRTATCSPSTMLFPALLSMDGYLVICRGLPQLAPGLPTLTKAGKTFKKKTPEGKTLYVWGKALVTTRTNPIKGEANIKGKSCVYAFSFHSQEYRWTVSEFSSSISEPAVHWDRVHGCWLDVAGSAFTPTIRKHLAGKQWRPQVSPLANWPPLR